MKQSVSITNTHQRLTLGRVMLKNGSEYMSKGAIRPLCRLSPESSNPLRPKANAKQLNSPTNKACQIPHPLPPFPSQQNNTPPPRVADPYAPEQSSWINRAVAKRELDHAAYMCAARRAVPLPQIFT